MMSRRDREIAGFLDAAGWHDATRKTLAADASFRRYDRLVAPGRTAVLMDAPPGKEDVAPFVRVARKLIALGLSAPGILHEDLGQGLLLLEDFGDQTFTRLLDAYADAGDLYALATDVLIHLHRFPVGEAVPENTPAYSDALLHTEADLLIDWYLPAVMGRETSDDVRDAYRDIWNGLLPQARNVPETLVLRDYHVDNLMRLDGRDGVAACGLLDFQDAVAGPVSYDFVSLIEDARRDVAPDLAQRLLERYLAAFPDIDREHFVRSCAILGAQRHCKVLGIFTRLRDRDGKPDYLVHVPRLWRLLEKSLKHNTLAPLGDWLAAHVPADCRIVPPERSVA